MCGEDSVDEDTVPDSHNVTVTVDVHHVCTQQDYLTPEEIVLLSTQPETELPKTNSEFPLDSESGVPDGDLYSMDFSDCHNFISVLL